MRVGGGEITRRARGSRRRGLRGWVCSWRSDADLGMSAGLGEGVNACWTNQHNNGLITTMNRVLRLFMVKG